MRGDADARAVRAAAHDLTGAAADFDPLLDRIGDAGCVLLGEATHGTHEFYAVRAHVTQRLIEEQGFHAVAVEADWPDAHRAGRWASGADDDPDAVAALGDFTRFPRWLWRNPEVVSFLQWLREHNDAAAPRDSVGLYGLDLVALHERPTLPVGPAAWNVRERHMADTLHALRTQLGHDGAPGKVVVWAHNSHVGDARATELAGLSQLTLGQLVRETYGARDVVLVGLGTYTGTVVAASDWAGPAAIMPVAPAREDSTDALLHATGLANLLLVTGADAGATAALQPTRLQRAIGAIYRPETERVRHYVFADVTRQFDALVHLDTTTALEPLDPGPGRQGLDDAQRTHPTVV